MTFGTSLKYGECTCWALWDTFQLHSNHLAFELSADSGAAISLILSRLNKTKQTNKQKTRQMYREQAALFWFCLIFSLVLESAWNRIWRLKNKLHEYFFFLPACKNTHTHTHTLTHISQTMQTVSESTVPHSRLDAWEQLGNYHLCLSLPW